MSLRPRFLAAADKALAAQIVLVVSGTALAFGGAVWWMKPALAALVVLMTATWLARSMIRRRWVLLKSPLAFLGLAALGLALFQLTPLPGRLASVVSPRARTVHALGVLPDRAMADDPTLEMPEVAADRIPATLDRPATLRWLLGAAACLAVFVVCSHFADRFGHSALIWGSVVAAFFVGTTFGVAQILGGVSGLYGSIEPGSGRLAAPTLDDAATAPGMTALRTVGDPAGLRTSWSLSRPDRPFLFGTLMGGSGAYLALGTLGLPLALGMALQLLAPRGSREGLGTRLRDSGKAGLLVLLLLMTWTGAILIGTLAGPILILPFALGVIVVGLPAARSSGLRWVSVALTAATLAALCAGVVAGERRGRPRGADVLASAADGWPSVRSVWREAAQIARDFPIVGTGMGSYPTIAAYYKARDETWTTAQNSLLQWWVESGLAGMTLVGLAGLWCLFRLPGAIRRVGTADRTLAFTLVGTAACFGAFSAMHWTTELTAVAVAACAVAGTGNRWLAGGTDLFVERT